MNCLSMVIPYTSKQNVVAVINNWHLLNMIFTLLLESCVPVKLQVVVLSIAIYLINRLPYQVLNFDSLCYRLCHQHPSYLTLHIFWCIYFVHLSPHECHKLSVQFVKCALMGYSLSHKGYVCYDHSFNKFSISRNTVFFEIHSFFSIHIKFLPEILFLPYFNELNFLSTRFKPSLVYNWR